MSAKPQRPEVAAAATPLRLVAGPSARAAAESARPQNAIIGHRLPKGYMSVHAPGQPCGLCEGGPAISGPRAAVGRRWRY